MNLKKKGGQAITHTYSAKHPKLAKLPCK